MIIIFLFLFFLTLFYWFILFITILFLFSRDADLRKGTFCPFCVPIHKKKKFLAIQLRSSSGTFPEISFQHWRIFLSWVDLPLLHCMLSIVYLHLIFDGVFGTCLVLFWSFWPYCSSEFFKSTMPAMYLITGSAHVFMAFTVYPELSFNFNIAFNLFMYSFFIFSISWCFIFSPSIIPK